MNDEAVYRVVHYWTTAILARREEAAAERERAEAKRLREQEAQVWEQRERWCWPC